MRIEIKEDGTWFHGSNRRFDVLRAGSTITQWQALAEAFSHQPSRLGYDDDGIVGHNGTEYGYLYMTGVIPSFGLLAMTLFVVPNVVLLCRF